MMNLDHPFIRNFFLSDRSRRALERSLTMPPFNAIRCAADRDTQPPMLPHPYISQAR